MSLDGFRYYTGWHDLANRKRYAAPADPWKTIRVDPTTVEFFTVIPLTWGLGRVRGGEWDRIENCRRVDDTAIHEGLIERFENGLDWRDTVYYEWADGRLADRGEFRGCETIEEFEALHCARIDELFESIREEGYRPNRGTVYETPADVEYVHDLEPLVLIGRTGEIYWSEGFHRLVLAKILGVERVPAYVLRRHEHWQRIREGIDTTPAAEREGYVNHPDTRDIVR